MTIQITGSLIANNAAMGALIGVLSVNPPHSGLTTLKLESNPNGYFLMSDKGLLYVRWIGTVPAGNYPIRIHAHGVGWNEYANIVIRVVAAAPSALSPDGTVITGGTGKIVTVDGTWTFGAPLPAPDLGYWQIIRNGVAWPSGGSSKMEVANGGKLYELGTGAFWYTWVNDHFAATSDPTPDPTTIFPTAITLNPAVASLLDNTPPGVRICEVSVQMSDNSHFAGMLTTSDTNLFGISGSNVVTARALTPADDGTHSTVITATQGGQSVAAKI